MLLGVLGTVFTSPPSPGGFKNPWKKIRETRRLEPFHEKHFVERKNEARKQPDKNLSMRRLEFMPRNLD